MDTVHDPNIVNTGPHVTAERGLEALVLELERRSRKFIPKTGLVFAIPPTIGALAPELPTMDSNDSNLVKLSLTSNEPANAPVIEYEDWLLMARKKVLFEMDNDVPSGHLLADLEKEFFDLERQKICEWRRLQESVCFKGHLQTVSGCLARPADCISVDTGASSEPRLRVSTHTSFSGFLRPETTFY